MEYLVVLTSLNKAVRGGQEAIAVTQATNHVPYSPDVCGPHRIHVGILTSNVMVSGGGALGGAWVMRVVPS